MLSFSITLLHVHTASCFHTLELLNESSLFAQLAAEQLHLSIQGSDALLGGKMLRIYIGLFLGI